MRALRAAVDSGDLAVLGALLAEDVQWFGAASGACHGRDEVRGRLRQQIAGGIRAQLR